MDNLSHLQTHQLLGKQDQRARVGWLHPPIRSTHASLTNRRKSDLLFIQQWTALRQCTACSKADVFLWSPCQEGGEVPDKPLCQCQLRISPGLATAKDTRGSCPVALSCKGWRGCSSELQASNSSSVSTGRGVSKANQPTEFPVLSPVIFHVLRSGITLAKAEALTSWSF